MAQDPNTVKEGVKEMMLNSDVSIIEKIAALFIFDATRAEILMMWFFLGFLIIGFILLLRAWNNDENNDILISDLICIDGRLNESKMARFGAFVVSTWAFVYLVVTDGMTEWYFVGYMTAWVGNALFSKYMNEIQDKNADNPEPPLADEEEELTPRRRARKASRQRI